MGARDRRHHVGRQLAALQLARPQPRRRSDPQPTECTARHDLAAPQRRLLLRREDAAARPAAAACRCTGSSGRRTRRGSPASRCCSSCTTSAIAPFSPIRRSRRSAISAAIAVGLGAIARRLGCSTSRCSDCRAARAGGCARRSWIVGLIAIAIALTQRARAGAPRFFTSARCSATIMAGNVAMTIVPSQRQLVASVAEGRGADPAMLGARQARLDSQQLFHVPRDRADGEQPFSSGVRSPVELGAAARRSSRRAQRCDTCSTYDSRIRDGRPP